jgi:predicted dehydrogenase
MTGIAFVGTGFVADYYMTTLGELSAVGACAVSWDQAPAQLDRFCAFYNLRKYGSLADVLADPGVEIIINLTTPESHYPGLQSRPLKPANTSIPRSRLREPMTKRI